MKRFLRADVSKFVAIAIALAGAAGCARPAVSVDYRGAYDFTRSERAAIEGVANRAARDVRPLLPTLPMDLRLTVDAGDRVIPETGENGSTGLPRTVYWIVNPDHAGGVGAVVNAQLRATLFHEWYHLVREASLAPETLAERAVSEGLATAFERDFGGALTPWGAYPADVQAWTQELLSQPPGASSRHWMSTHPDGRRWVGYKVGTYIADRAVRESGRSLAQLATEPTERIISWAKVR